MLPVAMKNNGQNALAAAGKRPNSPFPVVNLLSYLFLFVSGLTLGIFICFHYKSFYFRPPVRNSQPSPIDQPPTPPSPQQPESPSTPPQPPPSAKVDPQQPPPSAAHGMSEEELMWRASMAPRMGELTSGHVAKIAFMFLTRGPVIMAPLWERFFKGINGGLYSVYVHSDPSFKGSEAEGSVFHGRRIPSKAVQWGNVSMAEAERRLLANALLDFSNQYFVLLSENCIPIYNFSTVYSYLINSSQSFVESFDDPGPAGRGRYKQEMAPTIILEQWRKGSQWFQMDRDLALRVISDRAYFSVFQKYCYGWCYTDEHYLPTFVALNYAGRNANRTLTWVQWPESGGSHPLTYTRTDVTPAFLERMRTGGSCDYNGRHTDVCFMFARKFNQSALPRLMKFAPRVLHFNE